MIENIGWYDLNTPFQIKKKRRWMMIVFRILTNIKISIFGLNPSSTSLFCDLLLFGNIFAIPECTQTNRSECLKSAHVCVYMELHKNIENKYFILLLSSLFFGYYLCSLWFCFVFFSLIFLLHFVNLNLYCFLKHWREFGKKTNIKIFIFNEFILE